MKLILLQLVPVSDATYLRVPQRERGGDRATGVHVDVRAFEILAEARFHCGLAVREQVVRQPDPWTEIFPIRDVVHRIEDHVPVRNQRTWRELVGRDFHILKVVAHAVKRRDVRVPLARSAVGVGLVGIRVGSAASTATAAAAGISGWLRLVGLLAIAVQ